MRGRILIFFILGIVIILVLVGRVEIIIGLILCLCIFLGLLIRDNLRRWLGIAIVTIYVGGILVVFSYFIVLSFGGIYERGVEVFLGRISFLILIFLRSWSEIRNWNVFGSELIVIKDYLVDLVGFTFFFLILFLAIVSVTKIVGRRWGALRVGIYIEWCKAHKILSLKE